MAKLQACAKCGAQFDVSAMAVGTKFTCGACGAVVSVGAAVPGGGPSAPMTRSVPAPAAPAGKRGPQYVPPDRQREAAAAGSSRGTAPRADRGEHPRHGGGGAPKKGLSPVAMAGIGGGVLLVAFGALMLMNKGDDKKGSSGKTAPVASNGGPIPATPIPGMGDPKAVGGMGEAAPGATSPAGIPAGDSIAAIEAEYKRKQNHSGDELKSIFSRYQALGGVDRAKEIALEIVRDADPNFKAARALLGHYEFAHDVPEVISNRKYPYIRAVEEASMQRWFDDKEAYDLAELAWTKTVAHAHRIETDSAFRALDGARREIDRDPRFKNYNYEAIFASPYLICYSSDERLTEEDFLKLNKKDRAIKLAELEKSRESFRRILAEKAKIYQQLYKEFLKRYGESCELKDLMGPFGGRPDLGAGKQSYRDGCPMIIWIFSDRKAFDDYHEVVAKERIDRGVAGYFSPMTGWVYLYDGDDREFEVNKNVHEGTHQLEHWFQMQKREWGKPTVPQSFFGEGFAEFMGAVNMARDRTLTFHGINRPRIEFLKHEKEAAQKAGKPLPYFPLKDLVGFEGYHNVRAWTAEKWGIDGILFFYAQSWALVYFMNEASNHKYQPNFTRFLDDMLNHPKEGGEGYAFDHFKRDMNIKSEDDWKKLDKEFKAFYEKLIEMDLAKVGAVPPSKDDWPGYVPIDPVNPLNETDTSHKDAEPTPPKKDEGK